MRLGIKLPQSPSPNSSCGEAEKGDMDENDPDIEFSPLCEKFERNGIPVKVHIYRLRGTTEGWSLEVVDHQGGSTVWSDLFAADKDAYAEFLEAVKTEGIASFLEAKPAH